MPCGFMPCRSVPSRLAAALALAFSVVAAPAFAQHKHGGGHSASHAQHQSHRFDNPEEWAKAFDDPKRAEWQKPDEVVKALALKPDMKIVDLGAGTGYFSVRLARAVPAGIVYAVDLEPKMVAYLTDRAKSLSLANLEAVQGSATAANLPEPVDLVLLVNVYHHIDDRAAYVRNLARSLKPGGRIAIIETTPEAPAGPPMAMRMSSEKVEKEMKAAGFSRAETLSFLPQQSFQIFKPVKL